MQPPATPARRPRERRTGFLGMPRFCTRSTIFVASITAIIKPHLGMQEEHGIESCNDAQSAHMQGCEDVHKHNPKEYDSDPFRYDRI